MKGNVEGQTKGTTAGKRHKNEEGALPESDSESNPITYKEWDLNNKQPGTPKDGERFVTGSDNSIYYTDNHYGGGQSPTGLPPFIKIKGRDFMGNQTENITKNELDNIRSKYQNDKATYYVELNGKELPALPDYFAKMSDKFDFPIPAKNYAGYDDWMRDFTWIDQQRIVIVISNNNEFLKQDAKAKSNIIEGFNDLIIPWWEHEVLECMVEGETKEFLVYLVD